MMEQGSFAAVYKALNTEQKKAVDLIDGPVLVIAGPGTGKTQLLGARVANILQQTDTPPQNILCVTFTESGAANMRERLTRFIGQAAYDVTISTYHAFGGDIIRRYPQYFTETRLERPVDELGRYQLIEDIVAHMSYANPLKQTQHHLGDLIATISEVKRALLTADDLRAIASENLNYIAATQDEIAAVFDGVSRMSPKYDVAKGYFEKVLEVLTKHAPKQPAHDKYGSLAAVSTQQLQQALETAAEQNSSRPLTAWKTKWLAKTTGNTFSLAGTLENKRLDALATVLEQYQDALKSKGLYDFDDMIVRTIKAMETHDELRYSLQEQYLYILLDEFQDTNAAQLKIVELLTNNPLSEGRPNVMAVGDDDQAIYAFQGAQYSNMLDFYKLYRSVEVVNLADNYRSHGHILETAQAITGQMSERLFTNFEDMQKLLRPANKSAQNNVTIERTEFQSDIAERDFVAERIDKLIREGVRPHEIAILAPRHSHLEALVPYLNHRKIPVHYEKRENILDAPLIKQLLAMARLVMALHKNEYAKADAYWPEALSAPEWEVPISTLWTIGWQAHETGKRGAWTNELLKSDGRLREAALLMIGIANRIETDSLEHIIDYLVGNALLETNEADVPNVGSPIRDFYLNSKVQHDEPQQFYETLSQLTVLRAKLREHQHTQDETLRLGHLLDFVQAYETAGQPMLHTSPYQQAADSVQLMTVYKAKGLEFEHVFLVSCLDDVWGNSGNRGGNKLTLPPNLAPIRHSGATEDEQLRLFFVAITRAKQGLHLTSCTTSYSGKATKRLKYLDEREQDDGTHTSHVLPEAYQHVIANDHQAPERAALELDWRSHHITPSFSTSLAALLKTRLEQYRLSPTHLNTFTDLVYGGPHALFFNTILRFPQAPSTDGQFGNAMHETLQWVQEQVSAGKGMPPLRTVTEYFTGNIKRRQLVEPELSLQIERGERALAAYLATKSHMFTEHDRAEVNFAREGALLGDVHLSGKIDRMEIDPETKTITVVDYKTGKNYERWQSEPKLHKYRQQLYCYKLLIEHSHSFRNYTVTAGRLEFVEPNADNEIHSLTLHFKPEEQKHIEKLLNALWQHVHDLNFPDVSRYGATLTGIKQFEDDLINGKI